MLGAVLFISLEYVQRAGLVKDEITVEMRFANIRLILIGQSLYAFGTLLCVFNT